jgi:NADPH:quinone reductase-like Zn-dependent oxidoreductase
MLTANERNPSLELVTDLVNDGKVTPAIDRAFELDQARSAMRHLDAGQVRGKIIITM